MIKNTTPKLKGIINTTPKFRSIEKTNMLTTLGFLTYDQAGAIYDEPGFTYDGITGASGNPPKF